MNKKRIIFLIASIIIISIIVLLLYKFNIIPHKQYTNSDFNIETYVSSFDYDLMELVNEDAINHKEEYNIETIDKNIDFRRVRNLNVYFKNNHIVLTTDLSQIEEWQGGDIIVFKDHIGVISDKRNKKGIPFLIHHANPLQVNYEEDVLELYEQDYIIGHYRIS